MRIGELMAQDVDTALRAIRRQPGVSLAIVGTLALGIGANVAMFSLVDRLFVQAPAGVRAPDELRRLYLHIPGERNNPAHIRPDFAYPAFVDLDSALSSSARISGYIKPESTWVAEGDALGSAQVSYATSSFLPLLGIRPAIGRFFVAAEDSMGRGAPVAVISYRFWQQRYDADPLILGRRIEIARLQYTIVGVAEPDFDGTDLTTTDVWVPISTYASQPVGGPWYLSRRSHGRVRVVARGRAETSDQGLRTIGTAVYRRGEIANNDYPDSNATILVGPINEARAPSIGVEPPVAISTRLAGVAIIVLLIACANVVNLLLSRMVTRQREIAVRLALGISRARLVGQLVTETMMLCLLAGAAALVIGATTASALRSLLLPQVQFASPPLDGRLAAFALLAATVTALAVGLIPALQASRQDLATALSAGRREGGVRHSRVRAVLITAQVAMSVLLLYGAGLFVRSLSNVERIDVGYETSRLVVAAIVFTHPEERYRQYGAPDRAALSQGLELAAERLVRRPDVEGTALSTSAPMRGYAAVGTYLPDGTKPLTLDYGSPAMIAVSRSYFQTTGLGLKRGRFPDARDGAAYEMVINETAARTMWPGRDPIGECLVVGLPSRPCRTVVGVVGDSHLIRIVERPQIQLFVPLSRSETGFFSNANNLTVRTAPENVDRVAAAMREELRAIFPNAEPPLVWPLALTMNQQLLPWRVGTSLFGAFGLLALVVAAIGIYSVISYSVTQRSHELGLRVALGARADHLTRMILGQGTRMVLVGVTLGAAGAVMLSRAVEAMLYETPARDPAVLGLVAVLLVFVAVLACLVPLARALRTDPAAVLRAD